MDAIKTSALTKSYGKHRGVIDLNFSVEEGETFGFIGPNGAGKSITIRLFLNLLFPTSGGATVLGHDIIREAKKIKQQVGFIPSEVNFYNFMTAKELLKYSANFYQVPLNGHYKNLVDQLEIDLDKKFEDLSMGNKKKVAIVQAMIHKPRLLILDEPTSGLDPLMQSRFFALISEANKQGTTVFFSSHILSEVEKLCHRVAIIKEGKIVRMDDVETIKATQLSRIVLHFSDKLQVASSKLSDARRAPDDQRSPDSETPDGPQAHLTISTPGVLDLRHTHDGLSFLFKGNIKELLKELSEMPLRRISIEEPDLEEVFMHYYEHTNGEEQS